MPSLLVQSLLVLGLSAVCTSGVFVFIGYRCESEFKNGNRPENWEV